MILHDYENQDPNWKFTMGDEKPAKRIKKSPAPQEHAAQAAKWKYKKEIRDLELHIQLLKRKQEDLAKLTPTEAETSEITDAIDSGAYVSKEIEIGVKIRDLEKILEATQKRFQFLFGDPE